MRLIPPVARRHTLYGGLTVGVLDILAAATTVSLLGGSPVRMLKAIASGLLGPQALAGDWTIALLGLGLHMGICLVIVAVFVVVALRWGWLVRHWLVSGAAYGVWVYFFMQYAVVANSAAAWSPPAGTPLLRGLIIHILFVGLPTAWFARQAALAAGRSNKA